MLYWVLTRAAVALLANVETGTNSCLFLLKYISKVLEGLSKVQEGL